MYAACSAGELALGGAKLGEKIASELKDVRVIDNGKLVAKEGKSH